MKQSKHADCNEALSEIKPMAVTDPFAVKYLVFVYTAFGLNQNATEVLENTFEQHGDRPDLGEQLFFAYVREGKTLRQQTQALHLYKVHERDIYAQWAVQSMYLVSKTLKFKTKIMDIANLILLKLMKE